MTKRATEPRSQAKRTQPAAREPRLLVANRGEIACRILRAAREHGWHTIAVYSDADRMAPHVTMADEAHWLGGAPSPESYLNLDRVLALATRVNATHLHPGYGFFSENARFAEAVTRAGITLVGPPAHAIASMGDKIAARAAAERAGVPLVPGSPPLPADPAAVVQTAERIGYPVLIKAAFGGGGKGMRLCRAPEELVQALGVTRGEAGRSFGNDTIFLERALLEARHVEIQVVCDAHGHGIYLGERECSIQRRHQKLIEETPCVALAPETRRAMGEAAIRLATGIGYVNAGTVEFLLDKDGQYYFLEMNTRLQVEHPVTEEVTDIDLVRLQLDIAEGKELPFTQDEIRPHGAAIECRILAEDPEAGFMPASGPILWARLPQGPGVRNDVGFEPGGEVSVHYDSMIGKLITRGRDREEARARMLRALREYTIEGVRTNLVFLRWVLSHPAFIAGNTHTRWVDECFRPGMLHDRADTDVFAQIAAVAAFRDRMGIGGIGGGGGFGGTGSGADNGKVAPGGATDPLAPRISSWKRRGTRWKGR